MGPPVVWAKYLDLILFVAAARSECSGLKLVRLKEVVIPALNVYRTGLGDEHAVKQAVREVMGANWKPASDWQQWIDALS